MIGQASASVVETRDGMTSATATGSSAPPANATKWLAESPLNRFHLSLFFACLLINTMEGYDLYIYASAMPALTKALSLSDTRAGLVASAASFGTLIGALIFGPLADKVGRKRIILGAATLACLSMAAAGLSQNFTGFIGARLVFGIANGALVVNILALLSEYVPSKSRATLVGLVASGVSVGGLLGPLVGLWAYPRFGWRSFFLISSVMIVLVPLFARWLPEASSQLARTGQRQRLLAYLRRARPQTPLADNVDIEVEQGRGRVPLSEVFKDGRRRGALLFWLCYLMNMYVIYGFSFWLPKLMITRGFTLEKGLTFLIPTSLASIAMTYIVGRITDRRGAKPVLAGLYLLSCTSIILVGLTSDYVLLMILVGLAGAGFNGAQNMMNAYSPTYFPPSMRSTSTAFNFVAGRVGGVAGPAALGVLLSVHVPFEVMMLTLALPSLVALAALVNIPDKYSFNKRLAIQG
jgi:AAHS family benzoate transporter-like MFS transporter